jgi:hypothetical protein
MIGRFDARSPTRRGRHTKLGDVVIGRLDTF